MNLSVGVHNAPYSAQRDKTSVYLKQGECYVSKGDPGQVRTVLGSCVTVTMHCPILNIGGITHSLLPFPLNGVQAPPDHIGRYVNTSIKYVYDKLCAKGVIKRSLQVKVFGGAQMFWSDGDTTHRPELNIGRRNVETALETISNLGLTVAATDVGGRQGRKLVFFPHQGDVWVKKINRILKSPGGGND